MDKFNINKNGWLWGLHATVGTNVHHSLYWRSEEVTLCTYFWNSSAILAGLAIIGVCVLSVAVFVIAFAYSLTIAPYIGFMGWEEGVIIAGLFLTGCIGATGLAATADGLLNPYPEYIYKPVGKLWAKLFLSKPYTEDKEGTPKPPSLVSEYLKAKKAKWCPLVEIVDYDKEQ